MGRFEEAEAAALVAKDNGTPEGLIAQQPFTRANPALRSKRIELAPTMGLTGRRGRREPG